MKALLKNTKFLICFLVLVATVCITIGTITLTSSSYVTSVNQYAAVATTTPAKLNGEVKLSFCNGSNNKQDDGVYYITSSYSSSYYMAVENASNMTDYFDNPLSSMDESTALEYFDIFGSVKSKNSYGSLTGGSFDYTMPLATEWNVGSAKNGQTTFNITPFSTDISVTIYFSMGATLKADGEYYARTNWSAFVFNNNEIAYDPDGSNTSDGLVKCDNNAYGAYSFTASTSSEDHKNSHDLYMYTTTVKAEEAINIATATQSQAMIFLIVLTPVTGVAVKDNSSATSSYISTNGTVTLTASSTLPSSLSTLTGTWTTSNTSVATISSTSGTTITVTAVGSGVAQITYTIGGATAVYTVYVVGASISGSNTVYIGKTADYTADIYLAESSGLSVNSYEWELESVSSTGCVSIKDAGNDGKYAGQTVILTGAAEGSATLKLTVTLSDSSTYTAELAITVTEVVPTDAEINITTLVDEDELSATTYKANTTLYSGSDGTSVTVLATSDKTVAVDDNTKSIDGFSFSYRLKLSGNSKLSNNGNDNYRAIKIETVSEATITVYAMSGSKGSTRRLVLYNSSYTALDDTQSDDGNDITKYTYTVSSDGTYYLGAPDDAMNIYYIKIDYPETGVAVSDGSGTSSTISVGDTLTLTATLTNISLSDYDLAWSITDGSSYVDLSSTSDNPTAVTAKLAGTAEITVTATEKNGGSTNYTATYTVTVQDSLTVVNPTTTGATTATTSNATIYSGLSSGSSTMTISATSNLSMLYWTSSNTEVATIAAANANALLATANEEIKTTGTNNNDGTYTHSIIVTAVAAGEATITASTASSSTGTVVTYGITVANLITLDHESVSLAANGTATVTATLPESVTSATYAWELSETTYVEITDGSAAAAVTLAGKNAGTSTATLTLTVTINGVTYTATCAVTITEAVTVTETVVYFTSDGVSDTSLVTVSGTVTTDTGRYGTVTYGDEKTTYEYFLKVNGSSNVLTIGASSTARNVTFYFGSGNGDNTVYITMGENKTSYTIDSETQKVTVTLAANATLSIAKNSGESQLFLIVLEPKS